MINFFISSWPIFSPNSGFNLSISIANASVNFKTNRFYFILDFHNDSHFLNFSKNIQELKLIVKVKDEPKRFFTFGPFIL